jgi:uncharacterized caspase-like protein/peptidoglycan hydrolase-like protein with peptidoglycan-binding domain
MRPILLVLWFVFAAVLSATPGHAQNRVALVIGNSAYRNVVRLPNPQNDAADIAASLQRLGFSVTSVRDAAFDDMRRALVRFGRDAQGADMAIVYFAGHGMEIGGENWLIPVDAELRSDRDAENEAISLKSAMLQVSNAATLGMVILDSCRDNPFAVQMQRVTRTRAVDRGLARVEPADNVIVAYGAKDGTVANDGQGRNSPFTAALLNNLERAGVEIRFLLASVRDDVLAATNRMQQPFVYGSLSRQEIFLKPPAQSQTATPAPPNVQQQLTEAERAWATVQTAPSVAAMEAFVRRFPDTFYADLARVRIEEIKKAAVVLQPAPPPVAPPPPDEEQRRQEALKQQQQEEQKRREAERQRLAALEQPQKAMTAPPPAPAAQPLKANLPEQIHQAQTELSRLGCFKGKPDGRLNDETRKAVSAFLTRTGGTVVETGITDELIADLHRQPNAVCSAAPRNPPAVASHPPAPSASHPAASAGRVEPLPVPPASRPPAFTSTQAPAPKGSSLGTGF